MHLPFCLPPRPSAFSAVQSLTAIDTWNANEKRDRPEELGPIPCGISACQRRLATHAAGGTGLFDPQSGTALDAFHPAAPLGNLVFAFELHGLSQPLVGGVGALQVEHRQGF